MSLFDIINTSSTGMVANRFWLDLVAGNIANASTTRTAEGTPYRRRMPVFTEALQDIMAELDAMPLDEQSMDEGLQLGGTGETTPKGQGVNIVGVAADPSPLTVTLSPGHPDANEEGYVSYPNVNIVREMVDMISANRAYDANVQVVNAAKSMITKALEIGK